MNENQEVSIKFINTIVGDKKLQEYEERLQNIYGYISSIKTGQGEAIKKVSSATEGLNKEVVKTTKDFTNMKNVMGVAFNTAGIVGTIKASAKLIKSFSKLTQKSSEYIENVNLLEVAYANVDKSTGEFNESIEESSERIETFIDKMATVYGLDESRLTRQFGIFKQLANAMDLPNETAEQLSEHMVKMTNDIASLYNLDLNRASNALQSALAGQVRPIRGATGADITEKTLQNTVDALGLDRSISQLSYVEKRLIMVISLTEQLKNSQGDYGRTINSVSNQVRIFHEQWERVARSMGNVFYPILEKILPYCNAILMVLKEIFDLIASLLGFEMPEFDYSGLAGASEYTDDIIEGMNDAGKSVDKLKDKMSGLRGFDKLNVINTPTDASSGGAGSGIDPRIMDAFNASFGNYNDMMEEVQLKAKEIADDILDWLGFSDGTYTNLKLIGTILGIMGGFKIFSILKGLFTGQSLLGKALGTGGLYKTITKIFGKKSDLSEAKNAISGANSLSSGLKEFKVPSPKTIIKGMADLAIIIGGTVVIIEAIGLLTKIPGFKETATEGIKELKEIFWGIASIALPLVGVATAIGIMGKIGIKTFAVGIADLAIVVAGTTVLVTAIGALMSIPYFKEFLNTGVESLIKTFNGIWEVAIPIAGVSAYLIAMGLVTPAPILAGLAGFALVIGGVELILLALGGLNQIPGFDWIIGEGSKVLLKLGETLGGFAGSIVSGFVGKAFDNLGEVGTHLSEFMTNAKPFFDGLNGIDESSTRAVSALADCILKLTANDILQGLASWLGAKKTSLKDFGKDLADFAPHFVKYANIIKDVNNDVVEKSAKSATAIAEMAKKLPNSGGLKDLFTGSNDLKDFGKMLPQFGKDMKEYADNISGLDTQVVDNSTNSAKAITEMANNLPNEGGMISLFTGDNKLSDFGNELKTFGGYFKGYYLFIKDISHEKVDAVTNAIKYIVDTLVTIKKEGLTNVAGDFGRDLKQSAIDLSSAFNTNFSGDAGWNIGYGFGKGFANGMSYALRNSTFPTLKLLGEDYNTLQQFRLKAYKGGGLPPVGQIFVANEDGPELIDQIGGQTFVANQKQIGAYMDKKYGANSQPINLTMPVEIGGERLGTIVINDLQNMAKTNGKPIVIGG